MLPSLKRFIQALKREADWQDAEDEQLRIGLRTDDEPSEPLAYAALLVELAMVDGRLDPREEAVITALLTSYFKLSPHDAAQTLSSAKVYGGNSWMRKVFLNKIREEYSPEEQQALFQALGAVVAADGRAQGEELVLVQRLRELLS